MRVRVLERVIVSLEAPGNLGTRPWPRRTLYFALGAATSTALPLGYLALAWLLSSTVCLHDLAARSLAVAYMALAGGLLMGCLGFFLGTRQDRLLERSITDPLTGLGNLRWLNDRFREEFARSIRYSAPLSVLLVDLDGLKRVNDAFGHAAGDAAIRAVALAIRQCCRLTDLVARCGGDEFVVLAPATSATEALLIADRVRAAVKRIKLAKVEGAPSLSVSVGIADIERSHAETAEKLLAAADCLLYEAKRRGRDRAMVPPRRAMDGSGAGILSDTAEIERSELAEATRAARAENA